MKTALTLSLLFVLAVDEPNPSVQKSKPAVTTMETSKAASKSEATEKKPATATPGESKSDSTKNTTKKPTATPKKVVKKVETFADVVARLTSNERARYGRGPVTANAQLNAAAQSLANYMAATGRFSHYADGQQPSTRVRRQNFRGMYLGENIVMRAGYSEHAKEYYAQQILRTWMNSAGHRNNILHGHAGQIGIAVATGRNGMSYAVMVVGTR